jgi:hypothetical protein
MAVVLSHAGSAPFALSHASAAAVHGLPVPASGRAWLTVGAGHGARTHYDAVLRQEVATLPPDHVHQIRGWPVTTAGRTVADCLRHLPASAGVAVADAALHRGLVCPEDVQRLLRWQQAWPLASAARAAMTMVDGRRESALESRSAVVMRRYRLPPPLCQVDIRDARGGFVARSDFVWPEFGVIGEADGRAKYGVDGDAVRAFEAEKDRQAALEALGLLVVRWGSRHLLGDPPPIVVRLRAAFARTPRPRFTGSLAQVPLPYTQ